jgi:mitochondrial enoyl-[acyl-carrier protein] reductase / trans-2-enoyl-CoA reductase
MPLACQLEAFGASPPAIHLADLPALSPARGEVLLSMLAAPINPADLNVIEGTYGQLPELPATLGNEGCGVVASLGPGVSGFQTGDLVVPLVRGTWTECLCAPQEKLLPLPASIDPLQASMLAVNPATAWRLLHDFRKLQPGDWIVQNAANSGVGRAVIGIAKNLGLRTLNLVRRPELADELRLAGADIVESESCDLRVRARELCDGALPRLALNAVGGASALNLANALDPGSPLVTYGAMSRQPLKIPNGLLIFKNISFHGFWLRRWIDSAPLAEIRETYSRLADLVADGSIRVPIQKTFPLREAAAAVALAADSSRTGKILLDLRQEFAASRQE